MNVTMLKVENNKWYFDASKSLLHGSDPINHYNDLNTMSVI